MYSPLTYNNDLDDAPLYVDARTPDEFGVANLREEDTFRVDLTIRHFERAVGTATWLSSIDRYRFGMRVVFPLDGLDA